MEIKNVDHELLISVQLENNTTYTRHYSSLTGVITWHKGYTRLGEEVNPQLATALEVEYLKKHSSTLHS